MKAYPRKIIGKIITALLLMVVICIPITACGNTKAIAENIANGLSADIQPC